MRSYAWHDTDIVILLICLSICPSYFGSKWLDMSLKFFHYPLAKLFQFSQK